MKNRIVLIIGAFVLGLSGFSAWAADAPPPPLMAETWGCSYKPGKDIDDLLKARDNLLKQAEKAGIDLPPSYMWSLIKGNVSYDTVWLNVHQNLGAFGANNDAWAASGLGEEVLERFYDVSDCSTGMAGFYPIFQKEGFTPPEQGSTRVVATLGCTFNHGVDIDHMPDLANHMSETMASMGDAAPMVAVGLRPFTARPPGSPDVILVSAFNSMSGWTNYVDQLFSTPAGETLRNHMDLILDCDVALWGSQTMVAPAGE